MAEPVVAQKAPCASELEAGKTYILVRLREIRQPAVLRRLA